VDIQKERKSTFFTAFEHREKEARSFFLCVNEKSGMHKMILKRRCHW